MGLTPKAFWALLPAEFDALQRGHARRTLDAWRHTRHLGNLLRNINRGEKDPATTDAQYLPLPGEPEHDEAQQATQTAAVEKTAEERAAQQARILERFAYVQTQPKLPAFTS